MTQNNSSVVRWQLDMQSDRARELDELSNAYGFGTRKELVNTALSFLQWAIDEVKTGRIVASVDEKNTRYKQIDLPAFKIATQKGAAERAAAEAEDAPAEAILESISADLELLSARAGDTKAGSRLQRKVEEVRAALADVAEEARA